MMNVWLVSGFALCRDVRGDDTVRTLIYEERITKESFCLHARVSVPAYFVKYLIQFYCQGCLWSCFQSHLFYKKPLKEH